jgi:hypothetical protein
MLFPTVRSLLLHTTTAGTREIIAVFNDGKRVCLIKLGPSKNLATARRLASLIAINLDLAKFLED